MQFETQLVCAQGVRFQIEANLMNEVIKKAVKSNPFIRMARNEKKIMPENISADFFPVLPFAFFSF